MELSTVIALKVTSSRKSTDSSLFQAWMDVSMKAKVSLHGTLENPNLNKSFYLAKTQAELALHSPKRLGQKGEQEVRVLQDWLDCFRIRQTTREKVQLIVFNAHG